MNVLEFNVAFDSIRSLAVAFGGVDFRFIVDDPEDFGSSSTSYSEGFDVGRRHAEVHAAGHHAEKDLRDFSVNEKCPTTNNNYYIMNLRISERLTLTYRHHSASVVWFTVIQHQFNTVPEGQGVRAVDEEPEQPKTKAREERPFDVVISS